MQFQFAQTILAISLGPGVVDGGLEKSRAFSDSAVQ